MLGLLTQFFLGLIDVVVGLFPSADPDTVSAIQNATMPIKNLLHTLSFIFPVDYFITVMSLIFATELLMFGVKASIYVLHFITAKFIPKL